MERVQLILRILGTSLQIGYTNKLIRTSLVTFCLLFVIAPVYARPQKDILSETTSYQYEVSPTSWQCGTQEPAANIIKARFEPDSSTNKIRVYVAKCNGSSFSSTSTIRIIMDDTGQFRNWRYRTSTTGYQCGGIIEFRLLPYSGDFELRGTAKKCDGTPFSSDGKMYIAANGNIIAGPEIYLAGNPSESIIFNPLSLNTAGRHTYQAYLQSNNNAPGDYIISGSIDAWEEYHSYLTGSWSGQAGQFETSFLFDPIALGVTSGWHKYQVHVYPAGQDYPIRSGIISARDIPIPQGDQYEPDAIFTQAKSIGTDGSSQTHTIHLPGDEDWVKFETQTGYRYVIETTNLQGGADTFIGLFWDENNDNHADLIASDDNSAGSLASRIDWTAPRTGTHYVKIRDTSPSRGDTGVAYNIRVTASAPQGDQYEADNVFTQAKSIGTDGSSQTHTIHVPGDEDWMKFDAITGYQYVIETFNLQGGADTVLGLFWDNQNDNHPDLIISDENPGPSRIVWVADQTATRWIKVRDTNTNLGGTNVIYSVKVTASAPQGDQYEADNVFTQAKSIGTDGSTQTHTIHLPGDEDWVKFDTQTGYRYVIETTNLQGGADTFIGLFWDENNDNHADLIVSDDNGAGGLASRIDWTATRTGTHHVKIRDTSPSRGGTAVAYNIRVTVSAPQGDQYEADAVFTQAKSIGTDGTAQTHTIHLPGDEDWVKFDTQTGYRYVIETSNLQGGADTFIGLFWDENNDNHADLIASDDNSGTGATSRIDWIAPRTSAHYIKIRDANPNRGGTGVSYTIRITANAPQSNTYEFYGKVTYPDGKPFPGAMVSVTQGEAGNYETATDEYGNYSLSAPAGRYLISAYRADVPSPNDFSPNADELGWIDIPVSRRIDFRANFSEESPPADEKILDVRYVDQVYAQQTSHNGYWDMCGPSSTAMLLHYEGKETRDVLYDRQATLDLCKIQGADCKGETDWTLMATAITDHGIQMEKPRWYRSFPNIKQSIDNNHPVIMGIKTHLGHLVLIVGYKGDNTLVLNDPYGEAYWWKVQFPAKRNFPLEDQPKLKGRQVEVSFSDLPTGGFLFVAGSTSPAPPQQINVTTDDAELIGPNFRLQLPQSVHVAALDINSIATLTHQPLRTPSYQLPNDMLLVNAFELTARDVNSAPIGMITDNYRVSLEVDPNALINWSLTTGQASANDEVNSFTSSFHNEINTSNVTARFVVLTRDTAQNKWVEVPYVLNAESNELVVNHNEFTEFVIAIRGSQSIYLPLVTR